MTPRQPLMLSCMLLLATLAAVCFAQDELEKAFISPPDSARAHTWWHWINGNVTAEGITADLEGMKKAGLGGFQAFSINGMIPDGPVKYMSDQWLALMHHAAQEAQRLGLEMCMHNCPGWSSSGGPWITPQMSMKKVVFSETPVEGPGRYDMLLQSPPREKNFYRDIIVLAFPTPQAELFDVGFRLTDWEIKAGYTLNYREKNIIAPETRTPSSGEMIAHRDVIDISDHVDDTGRLRWDAPPGRWTVLRLGYTTTGYMTRQADASGQGLECDKLSREAAELQWNNSVQKVIDEVGPLAGKVFNNVLVDSYEVWCQNWTPGFDQQFKQRMGYDMTPFMPALTGRVVDSVEVTERFLWDFRKVISQLFVENYYAYFAQMAHRNGLEVSVEPYGSGNFNDFAASDFADVPMGEWWAQVGQRWHHWTAKMAASAMHVNGRRYTGAEAFTAGGDMAAFVNHPYLLKSQGDYFFCKGINRFIFHTHVHQPWLDVVPGMTMGPWGGQYNRNNTWFFQGRAWLDYVARCQYLLQQGSFVADVCYVTGEQSPQQAVVREHLDPLLPVGYDYDFCSPENFMRMSVQDGQVVLPSGMSYRLLVLPAGPMRPAMLAQVRDLVKAGAIVFGSSPQHSPSLRDYPACDQQVQQLADEIWGAKRADSGEHPLGKGKVIWGKPLDEVLAALNLPPDFAFSGGVTNLPTQYSGNGTEYIHRRINDTDVYFVSNQNHCTNIIEAIFRISSRQPQLWHPDTGSIEQSPLYSSTDDGRTIVQLTLDPGGSVFVLFRDPADPATQITAVNVQLQSAETPKNKLEIRTAYYVNTDGMTRRKTDVTDEIRSLVRDDGRMVLEAGGELSGDPISDKLENLCVEYTYNSVNDVKTVSRGQSLTLPRTMVIDEPAYRAVMRDGKPLLIVQRNGSYQLQMAEGQVVNLLVKDVPAPTTLDGPWTLNFPKGWVVPQLEHVKLDQLIDWSQHDSDDVKHFSGTATYVKQFKLPAEPAADERVLLDLGQVQIMAEVTINGRDLGVLWKPPFRVDVTDALTAGENTLEIAVTNLWVNRLIGDAALPGGMLGKFVEGRIEFRSLVFPNWLKQGEAMPDNGRKTFVVWQQYTPDSPLVTSGMMGPVRLIHEKIVALP